MRVLIVSLLLLFTIGAGYVLGRTTAPERDMPGQSGDQDIVGRPGDVFRVPSIALFCSVDLEIDEARLLCNHTGESARYQVVFHRDRTSVGRIGFPGNSRVFEERQ